MAGEHRESAKIELALALAQGISAAKWARSNGVCKMTAYRWAKEPEVREMVESHRRRTIDQAIGRMTRYTISAADGIARLASDAESESVRLRACRAILADMIAVSKYSNLEAKMAEIDAWYREERKASTGCPGATSHGPGVIRPVVTLPEPSPNPYSSFPSQLPDCSPQDSSLEPAAA